VAALFVENARRFAEGRPLQALVDRARGYWKHIFKRVWRYRIWPW